MRTAKAYGSSWRDHLLEPAGTTRYTGWYRTLQRTGKVIYTGFYTTTKPPRQDGACVNVGCVWNGFS